MCGLRHFLLPLQQISYTIKRVKHHTLTILFFALSMAIIVSCQRKPAYPQLLVDADNMLMCGDNTAADSLLKEYDRSADNPKKAVQLYRQLIELEKKFVKGCIAEQDFSTADSLARHYDNAGQAEEQAKALLFLGEIYKRDNDYPAALNCYMQAEKLAEKIENPTLLCWVYRNQGDLYFSQRMFDECIPFYRKFYATAVANHDTLRISYAASSMGRVCTIKNEIDSTIYYYNKSIEMGKAAKVKTDIVPIAQSTLCDIYIQIEQFEKARNLMPHDELNDENWAFWHYGQQHTDSAIYYFKQMLGKYNPYAEVQNLRMLAQLYESKGDTRNALNYYAQLNAAEDSLRAYSQSEETRRMQAQYNYNSIKRERDQIATHSKNKSYALYALLVLITMIGAIVAYAYKYRKKAHDMQMAQEKLLRQEEERKYKQSILQIEENKRKIAELEQQLLTAKQQNDTEAIEKLKLDSELLEAENQNIEAGQRRREYLLKEFRKSDLYHRLILQAGNSEIHITNEDWSLIGKNIDEIYDNFTHRMLSLAKLSETEMRVCYLTKLEVPPAKMASVLFKSKSAITMIRQRLYAKITRQQGSAKELDEFIKTF